MTERKPKHCRACGVEVLGGVEYVMGAHIECIRNAEARAERLERFRKPAYGWVKHARSEGSKG